MTARMLEMSVPREGTINGRSIGIYTTDEHNGHVLMMFELDPTDRYGEGHGVVQLAEWNLPPNPEHDPVQIAQEILHDDAERRLIKAGVIKPTKPN